MIIALLFSSALMGVIWIVQLVHYPSFRYIESDRWMPFHQFHTRQISFVVVPLMLAELIWGCNWLYVDAFSGSIINLTLIICIWLATFLISVPLHNKLKMQYDIAAIESLVTTNWIRTVLWTIKTVLLMSVALT